jgi:glycosyltransferase involved in cell wall biosynthesis
MKLSIIMPTFKRFHLLKWGLSSLSTQKMPSEYEILVLNEGLPDDKTEDVCKEFTNLNIKYMFTGQRNLTGEMKWRTPCYPINIGIKQAKGDFIIITCPEIYHLDECISPMVTALEKNPKQMVVTKGKDDWAEDFLQYLEIRDARNKEQELFEYYRLTYALTTTLPFFMAMSRSEVTEIGGYDEDFGTGICFDDANFVDRMLTKGNAYRNFGLRIVHLYHPRLNYKLEEIQILWKKNEALYNTRKGTIYANQNREWGVLDES